MNKLGLNKISSERQGDRIMDRLNILLNSLKYIKDEKTIKPKFFEKSFVLIMTYF